MEDELKQPTLEIATAANLLDTAGELIATEHKDLADATIKFLWALGRPLTFWGRTKVASEEVWHLSKGVDIIVQVNESLWKKLSPAGRLFLVDLFLSSVQKKQGGKTEMEVEGGDNRILYQKRELTMGMLDAEVLARHPAGMLEIGELAKLDRALREPAQFLLDLQAIRAATEGGDGEDGEDEQEGGPGGGASDQPEPEPIYYYQTARLETGLRAGWLVFLQFDDPAKTPHHLTGVHFPEDQSPIVGGADPVDKSTLTFDQSVSAVRTYRNDLLADLEARRVAALEDSDGDGLDREIDDEPGADSEEEIIDQTIDDAIEAGEIEVPDLEEEGDAVGNAVATSGNVTRFARTAAR